MYGLSAITKCRTWCRQHSLSVACLVLGAVLVGIGIAFTKGEGMWWDLWSGAGMTFFTVGLINLMKGPLVEKNKEDEET